MRNLGSKGWSLSRNLWSPYLCRLVPGGPPPQPDQVRESSLKFQTRSIACFTDGQGYALGSVEGRVAMVGRRRVWGSMGALGSVEWRVAMVGR